MVSVGGSPVRAGLKFPTIATLAHSAAYGYLMTVPPTSLEAEQAFSVAGILWMKLRSRLDDHAPDTCFLPLDKVAAPRAVFVMVSGSDGQAFIAS